MRERPKPSSSTAFTPRRMHLPLRIRREANGTTTAAPAADTNATTTAPQNGTVPVTTPAITTTTTTTATSSAVVPIGPHQCFLSDVINGTCEGPTTMGRLTIIIDFVDQMPAAVPFPATFDGVAHLVVRGDVELPTLQWLLTVHTWPTVTHLTITGLQSATFSLDTLNPLPNLIRLDLSQNELLTLHSANFAAAPQLRSLDLSSNAFTTLDEALLAGMTSLDTLLINNNRLRRIGANTLGNLPALTTLQLHNNHITSIDAKAFVQLTSLINLDVGVNDLTSLASSTFDALHQLQELRLDTNPLTRLPNAVFDHLSQLKSLQLSNTHLNGLPKDAFAHTPLLETLNLYQNHISKLRDDVFSGLFMLQSLDLGDNHIHSLPPVVFRDLVNVTNLLLDDNPLGQLHPLLLHTCTRLERIFLQRVGLRHLPDELFAHTPRIRTISLNENRLTTVDTALNNLTALNFLPLSDNHLTRFAPHLPGLLVLDLSDNPLKTVPDLSAATSLITLRMRNHRIPQVDITPLLAFRLIGVLEMDSGLPRGSKATVHAGNLGPGDAQMLRTLSITNTDMSDVLHAVGDMLTLRLTTLHVGWRDMSEKTFPLQDVCGWLDANVREFTLAHSQYTSISLCDNKDFDSVFLQENVRLRSLFVHDHLKQLNVSGCAVLEEVFVPSVDAIDISRTSIHPTIALCTRWGRTMLFARELVSVEFEAPHAIRQLLSQCLARVQVLDLSGNSWLDTPATIAAVAARPIVLSTDSFSTVDGTQLISRVNPPLFQLANAPIRCSLRLGNDNVRLNDGSTFTLSTEITFFFECACAQRHRLTASGRCEPREANVLAIVAASVLASLAVLIPLLVWVYRRYRRAHVSDDLHKQLLVERDEEVQALKKAWEIGYDELRLIKRVAAGAFGTVFKAEWDSVTVAVKVLQRAAIEFDDTTVFEFEKEVEFLQRTRHPHVVRFFGAGTDPNGSPFLVLEYVAMGSLKDLLGKDMEKVLREYVRGQLMARDKSSKGEEYDLMPDTAALLAPNRGSIGGGAGGEVYTTSTTVPEFKLQLLRDVAGGMAFIHSLGHVHRDLKSGNVLVSSHLRAKIADFGSIRQCLTRPRSKSTFAVGGGDSVAVFSSSDRAYTQEAGTATMHLSMTAGVGTPLYMAPEVLAGGQYDAKADVFSFGVLMWEVATQRTPDLIAQEHGPSFKGPMLAALYNLLMDGRRLKYDGHGVDLPQWYRDLTCKCMEQDPARRPTFAKLEADYLLLQ